MQPNINPKLIEALKLKNIGVNMNTGTLTTTTRRKTPERSGRRNSSPIDAGNISSMLGTSSKFRVRPIASNNPDEAMRSTFNKTSSRLPPRPSTASKNDVLKTAPSQASFRTGKPLATQSGWSASSRNQLTTTKMSDDEGDNEINFMNMDGDDEFDAKIREELEIFNDIADLNENKLAEILKVDTSMLNRLHKGEMKVDLSFNSLQYAGEILSNLKQLKLNNSIINSLRDIGNSFKNLEILWISKCGLKDLGGLSSFPNLQELYAPYNCIKDLTDISYHTRLQVLDLEGNEIEKFETIENLISLDNLNTLTIEANPVCKIQNYEQKIFEILPNLELLNYLTRDEVKAQPKKNDKQSKPDQDFQDDRIKELYSKFEKFQLFAVEDYTRQMILNDMTKEPSEEDIIMYSVKKTSKKATSQEQDPDDFGRFSMKATSSKKAMQRPQTSKPRVGGNKGNSIFSDLDRLRDFGQGASDLIHQTDEAFAGNPLKALRHRRKNQFTAGTEVVKGENIVKPKDIMKLIEEFGVAQDNNDEEENKSFDDDPNSLNRLEEEDEENVPISKSQNFDTENDFQQSAGRANSLMNREGRQVFRQKIFSQEKKEPKEVDLQNLMNFKEINMQDIRTHLGGQKARVRIQIKTKKNPPMMPPTRPSAGKETFPN